MILELLAITAGVSAVAALLARRARRTSKPRPFDKHIAKKPTSREPAAPVTSEPRGLRIGDVLLYADTELWLAGALHLEEDGFVMRAFRTPGNTRAQWVVQLDANGDELLLCNTTSDVPLGAVPESLPIGGQRLALRRRGHARLRSQGADVPSGVSRSRYIELRGPGGRTLVVLDFEGGERLALLGDRVGRELLDLLPGGDVAPLPADP